VVALDKDMLVTRNADLSAVLIAYQEPTAATWQALVEHMDAERTLAESAREAKSKALLDRKKKVVEDQ
jgi:hypothetical protein